MDYESEMTKSFGIGKITQRRISINYTCHILGNDLDSRADQGIYLKYGGLKNEQG